MHPNHTNNQLALVFSLLLIRMSLLHADTHLCDLLKKKAFADHQFAAMSVYHFNQHSPTLICHFGVIIIFSISGSVLFRPQGKGRKVCRYLSTRTQKILHFLPMQSNEWGQPVVASDFNSYLFPDAHHQFISS